jgi:hypothetical protein
MVLRPCADVGDMNAAQSRRIAVAARDTGLVEHVDAIAEGYAVFT